MSCTAAVVRDGEREPRAEKPANEMEPATAERENDAGGRVSREIS